MAYLLDTKVIGFDSFQGFPEPTSPKDQRAWGSATKAGQWNINDVNSIKEKVARTCADNTVSEQNIELIEGFFEESLELYEPTKQFFFRSPRCRSL